MLLLRAFRRVAARVAAAMVMLAAVIVVMADPAHAASSLLIDNDATGPLVPAGLLTPGPQPAQCVQISYQSATDGDQIGLFGALSGGTGLENYLSVEIDEGAGGVYGDCSSFAGTAIFDGTLADFATTYGSASTALTAATLSAGNGVVSYRFTFTLADDNAAQGKTANAYFTWQAESPPVPPPSPSASPTPSPTPSPSPTPTPTPTPTVTPTPTPPAVTVPTIKPPARISPSAPTSVAPSAPLSSAPAVSTASALASPSPTPSAKKKTGSQTTVPVFGGDNPPSSTGFLDDAEQLIGTVVRKVVQEAAPAAKGTAFSLIFLVLLVIFLLVHSRIDRRDPKLANAPLLPNFLHFEPPLRLQAPLRFEPGALGGGHDLA